MVASVKASQGCPWQHVVCLFLFFSTAGAYVGIDYGTRGNNLPTPAQAVQLLKNQGVLQVRIYDTNATVLTAFQNSSIQLIVGILNNDLLAIGESNTTANAWVTKNIVPFANSTSIVAIAVGNEVITGVSNLSLVLVPAMTFIHSALVANNLDRIKVSTPCSMNLLGSTYPPSTGYFNATYAVTVMQPMLDFLSQTFSFFMLNVYPYKAYAANPAALSLDYALFRPNAGVSDSATGFLYTNLFDAQLDAMYAAMAKLNHTDLNIVVSESGWPTVGDGGEVGPSVPNAQTYISNLIQHVLNKTGTPERPGVTINTYLYELFSENQNVGPASQRNFGLFNPDLTPVYPISGINGSSTANQTWCVAKSVRIHNQSSGAVQYAALLSCCGVLGRTHHTGTYVNPGRTRRPWMGCPRGASDALLQYAIDFACGQGKANCTAIQQNGTCYIPNTKAAHASYAMNAYYQSSNRSTGTCDFQGSAQITTTNPSYGTCIYPSNSASQTSAGNISISLPSSLTRVVLCCLAIILATHMKLEHSNGQIFIVAQRL